MKKMVTQITLPTHSYSYITIPCNYIDYNVVTQLKNIWFEYKVINETS